MLASIEVEYTVIVLCGHPTLCSEDYSIKNLFLSTKKVEEKEVYFRKDFQVQIQSLRFSLSKKSLSTEFFFLIYFYFTFSSFIEV